MLNSFNVAMVVDPLEAKSVTNTFREEGAFDVSTAYVYTKSSSLQRDNLSLTSCVSAFVIGHRAISSRLSRGLINFQHDESSDNLIICEQRSTVPGDKATEAFEWLINHLCSKGDLVLAINTITALKAAIKNGRNCVRIVSDRENFERIKFSVAEETKELRSVARTFVRQPR